MFYCIRRQLLSAIQLAKHVQLMVHGTCTICKNQQSPTILLPHTKHRIALWHKACMLINKHQKWSHFRVAHFAIVCLDAVPPSHIWLLASAFFCSGLTSTLSMYTFDSIDCKGQAYAVIQIPHRNGTRESHKQLPKVMAKRYTYHPGRHTPRLYSTCSFSFNTTIIFILSNPILHMHFCTLYQYFYVYST